MAKVLKMDGGEWLVSPKNGTDFQPDELQGIVGGYIEAAAIGNGLIMVMNEEGKLKGLPLNARASQEYFMAYGVYEPIVGNVLICKSEEVR